MALVQMRTPGGSYSMVDEKTVPVYEAEGWVLTSELPEFKTKDVTYYDESRKTVTSSKGVEKPVEEVIEKTYRLPSITSKKEKGDVNNSQATKSVDVDSVIDNATGKIRTLTTAEYNEWKKLPIEEKKLKIVELASKNIGFRNSHRKDMEELYRITDEDYKELQLQGKAQQFDVIDSGPLNSGVDTWWQLLGYDTINEVNRDLASGALNINDPEVRRAKDNAQEKRGMGGIEDTRVQKPFGPQEFSDIEGTVTVFKDGKAIEILESDLHLYELQDWTADESAVVSTNESDTDEPDTNESSNVLSEIIGSTQVVVYGPNGARTTANTAKRDGEEMSEYDRLIAGLIEGREGYAGATQTEELTSDYPGDYGGEDSSTPVNERESVVGIGNTNYDNKDYSSVGKVVGTVSEKETSNGLLEPPQGGIQLVDLLNAPDGAYLWNVDGDLYVAYEVPGARGEVYDGAPLFMAYTVPGNDLVGAGLISPEAPTPFISEILKEDFDSITIVQSGNTDQLTKEMDHPFASFAETLETEMAVAPWLGDPDAISLLAEAALEGRTVTDAEWQGTTWWKEHSETERDWLVTYNSDPATASRLMQDGQIAVANSLQAAGVSNAPSAIVDWMANKYISGQWSQTYTTEQVSLFADPYASGKRDEQLENYLSSTAISGVDRTSEREREVTELYNKWLGPSLGKLTDSERAEIAGQLRDDPDYEDALINSLKQSRLAAFSNYTNPELTYEDIARPWRNLTTSVWGQTADETQGWWQEMLKSNDYATAQTTLREKGLEQDITQVTQDATQALQQALGQGSVSQTGVNV